MTSDYNRCSIISLAAKNCMMSQNSMDSHSAVLVIVRFYSVSMYTFAKMHCLCKKYDQFLYKFTKILSDYFVLE